MNDLEMLLQRNFEQMHQGALWWNTFVKEEKPADDACMVFFPEIGDEINNIALRYLQEYALSVKAKKVYFFYCDSNIAAEIGNYYSDDYKAIYMPAEDMDAFMKLYCLENISNRIIFVSLIKPEGRAGLYAIERNGLGLDDVIKYGIYRMARER